ncbi:hypothetical protein MARA_21810 [Mycolicibacterium arabiense]|uniref:REDY-like protein HapK n=1 Tax=Mycolicibacterium arabiense TaxID=1286181 RepID=A0A7I7RW32_9MYCO|nr:hypothetical protein [Mycolicibacterium arabiense]MCV7375562.1 hypothetical protein [Mycolicibacterium arabiense]BBY48713.1 hypothetical protein MARA_21810 [Mycolicibacterium arabiense]
MAVSAVNTFRLRPGVGADQFERFSAELDRPTCLAFDVVHGFDVYLADGDDAGITVVEVMTVSSWTEWQRLLESAPELKPVIERFDELVEPGSVSTLLTRELTTSVGDLT